MGIGRGSRGTWLIAGAFVLLGLEAMAQDAGAPRRTATQQWRASHATGIVRELADFVALPNVASDKVNIEQNARVLMAMLKRSGIEHRLLQEPGAPPAVVGER